jgi:hypothetical protein
VNLKNWMSALMRIWEYFEVALVNVKNYWQLLTSQVEKGVYILYILILFNIW